MDDFIDVAAAMPETPQQIAKQQRAAIDQYMQHLVRKCAGTITGGGGGAPTKTRQSKRKRGADIVATTAATIDDTLPPPDWHPTAENYRELLRYKFTLAFLKQCAKTCGVRGTGTKQDILQRVFAHYYYGRFAARIQAVVRGHLQRKYCRLQGPAWPPHIRGKLCMNSTDFVTLEAVTAIDQQHFYSYVARDEGGASAHEEWFGFHLTSLVHYFGKKRKVVGGQAAAAAAAVIVVNPYTRVPFPQHVREDVDRLVRLAAAMGRPLQLEIPDELREMSPKERLNMRALALFQMINELDNYSNAAWYLNLSRERTIRFLRDLDDIWHHRAQLTHEIQREICPPDGRLFGGSGGVATLHTLQQMSDGVAMKTRALDVLERIVANPLATVPNSKLGAMYVLGALTMVSNEAADAMPILRASFADGGGGGGGGDGDESD